MSTRKSMALLLYFFFLLVPIYWLLNMSFKSNAEILGGLTLWPQAFTLDGRHHRRGLRHGAHPGAGVGPPRLSSGAE